MTPRDIQRRSLRKDKDAESFFTVRACSPETMAGSPISSF
jgi:hypothetical protein